MVINGGGKAVVIPNSKCTLLIDQLVSSIKNIGIVDSVKKESLVGGQNKRKGSRKRLRGVTEYVESRDRLIEPAVCNIVTTSISPLVVLNVLVTSPQLDSNNEEQAAILALFSENGIQLLQQSPSYLLNCLCEGNPIITEIARVP